MTNNLRYAYCISNYFKLNFVRTEKLFETKFEYFCDLQIIIEMSAVKIVKEKSDK